MDGQLSGLGTVHPLLTLNFFSTWILPLHVVSSMFNRKSSSSAMDGLQRKRRCLGMGVGVMYVNMWALYVLCG